MPAIRIRVGASLDANAAGVVRPLVEAFRRAFAQISNEGQRATGSVYRDAPAHAKRAADAQVAAAQRGATAFKTSHEAALQHVARVRDRFFQQQQQQEAAAARAAESFGRRTSYRAARNFDNTLRAGGRFALDLARGAGIETNIGALVGKAVRLQTAATNLSAAAFQDRAGEKRVAPTELIAQARQIGNQFAFDPEQVVEGLAAFTSKTGELDVARASLAGLAELSRATGTNLEDMVAAAGEADKALGSAFGSPQEKAESLNRIMRVIARQGKLGAVEIRDLAVQMGKLSASAPQFEGSVETTMATLGAMTQFSIGGGGATSARQAATSIAAFTNTLKTATRVKAFEKEGVDVFSKKEFGKLKNPIEVIVESLKATQADPMRMKALFANVLGAKPVDRLTADYQRATAGKTGAAAAKAGEAAVRAQFATFSRGMTAEDVSEAAARSMSTNAAKVQLFNNKLAEVGAAVAERVLPQMEKLAPTIIDAVDALGKLAAWVAENPLQALFTALGASILRAAGEATLRAGVESGIKAAFGGGRGGLGGLGGMVGAPGGRAGAAIGAAGAALAIAATAITVYQVGSLVIDKVLDMRNKSEEATQNEVMKGLNAAARVRAELEKGPVTAGTITAAQSEATAIKSRIEAVNLEQTGAQKTLGERIFGGGILSGAANYVTGGAIGTSFTQQQQLITDKEQLSVLQESLNKINAALSKAGVQEVRVVNMPSPVTPAPAAEGPRMGPSGEVSTPIMPKF